jgi:hypothetical protein
LRFEANLIAGLKDYYGRLAARAPAVIGQLDLAVTIDLGCIDFGPVITRHVDTKKDLFGVAMCQPLFRFGVTPKEYDPFVAFDPGCNVTG